MPAKGCPRGYSQERTRAEAIRRPPVDLWRLELLPAYLECLQQVHFSAEWSRAWPERSKMPPAPTGRSAAAVAPDQYCAVAARQTRHDLPAALVEPALEQLPNATAVVLDQVGRMAHIDQPDPWLAAVRDFLDTPVE